MIELYSTNVTSTNDMTVPWNTKAVQTGYAVTLDSDGQTINLNTAGVYEVTVNATGTTTADGTFGFQLYGSGNPIVRAETSATNAAGDVSSVAFTSLVNVAATSATGTASLTVVYTGGAGTITMANIVIKKVA